MQLVVPLVATVLALGPLGCVSLKMGAGSGSSLVRIDGPVSAHVAAELPPAPDAVVDVGVLRNTKRDGEVVSVDVWPLFGVGIGVVGARVSVLGLEIGVGSLLYDPDPSAADETEEAPEAAPPSDTE